MSAIANVSAIGMGLVDVAVMRALIQREAKKLADGIAESGQYQFNRGASLVWWAKRHAVSRADFTSYNADEQTLYEHALALAKIVRDAGGKIEDPPTPKLFGIHTIAGVRTLTWARGDADPITSLSSFNYRDVWVQPDGSSGSATINGLGVVPAAAPLAPLIVAWAGRIILTLVAVIGSIFVLRKLRELIYFTEIAQQEYNEFAAQLGRERVVAVTQCARDAVEAAESAGKPVDYMKARQDCDASVSGQYPNDIRRPTPGPGLGKTVIYIGIGVGLIFGGLALNRYVRSRE